jgi:mannose-6-phosphate isomerase-like protein (cupin superfamily)
VIDQFETHSLQEARVVVAPDGSAVRPLCRITDTGSFAHFQLEPGEVAKAVSHATVQEIWYVVAGAGEMWRQQNGQEDTVTLQPGVCLTIPVGTVFQFRAAEGHYPLEIVAATMPPWPVGSNDEAKPESGPCVLNSGGDVPASSLWHR